MYFPFEYLKKQTKMKSSFLNTDKLSVRDNLDDEISDDIEDDVFIRDGKITKNLEDKRLKRPLMPPKKLRFKTQNYNHNHSSNSHNNYSYHNLNNHSNNTTCSSGGGGGGSGGGGGGGHSSMNNNNNNNNLNSNNYNKVPIFLKRKSPKCWKCCEPLFYGFIAIIIILGIIFLGTVFLTMFPVPLQKIKIWLKGDPTMTSTSSSSSIGIKMLSRDTGLTTNGERNSLLNSKNEVVPCTKIRTHKIWSKAISRINSETPVRKVDLNGDQIEDIVIGYGIDEFFQYNNLEAPRCILPKTDETTICEGGLLAFDGKTGETIWQRWTTFTIFSLYCSVDLNLDNQNDCVAAGRGGLIVALDGKNGNVLWQLSEQLRININLLIDLYTINPTRDLNDDSIPDILSAHVEETQLQKTGHIKVISGANGNVIITIPTPYHEEVFVPLQIITQHDGTESLLIISGGQNTPGGIYTIRLNTLMQYKSENDFTVIYRNEQSGFMVPAILNDITGDGVEDIIVSSFNSTVFAFDGNTSEMIWNYTFSASESISSIVPGYFDADNKTDFMVKYNTGPGFPVYYYSQTTILSGVNGKPLLDEMITDSGGPNSILGGITISENNGGDVFLHWQTECRNKVDSKDAYRFLPDSDIIQQSRADTCLLRFNTSTVLKLYAISRHLEPPGLEVFSTDDLVLQLNQTVTSLSKKLSSIYPMLKHPKMRLPKLNNKTSNGFTDNITKKNNIGLNRLNNLSEQMAAERIKLNNNRNMISIEDNSNNPIKEDKPYIYLPSPDENERNYQKQQQIQYELNQQQQPQQGPDYDMVYDENLQPYRQNLNAINNLNLLNQMANNNNNHGIRRSSKTNNLTGDGKKVIPETLWDLELEKETEEAVNNSSEQSNDSNDDTQMDSKKKKRRRRRKVRQLRDTIDLNQNLLSSISSTGVLVSSIGNTSDNTIDFIFVLNVRESEVYPPLYLAEDIECVENKMRNYENFLENNIIALEKEFLTQCLEKRLPNLQNLINQQQQYETQIVITRITIRCECENLNAEKEVCSKFNDLKNQKWTGFMGNFGNGIFPN